MLADMGKALRPYHMFMVNWTMSARIWQIGARHLSGVLIAAALVLGAPGANASGEHGGSGQPTILAPRAEARLGDKQLVLIYSAGRLFAFLEGFTSAEPIAGAQIEATVNFLAEPLIEAGSGVYRSAPIALSGGRNEIEVAWQVGADQGKATLFMDVAATAVAASAMTALPPPQVPGWVFLLAGVVVYASVTSLFWLRARGRAEAATPPGVSESEPNPEPQPCPAE